MRKIVATLFAFAFALPCQAQLMSKEEQAKLDAALPVLTQIQANAALHGTLPGKRLFYTGVEIPQASQDHGAQGTSFYLSAHNRSANKDGFPGTDFDFPWKNPGGADFSPVYAWKVMYMPEGAKVRVHRTVLRSFFSGVRPDAPNVFVGGSRSGHDMNGYDWTFPVGTMFFEVLSFSDRMRVFEVRTRTKVSDNRWRMNLYRPFLTRDELTAAVDGLPTKPNVLIWTLTDKGDDPKRVTLHRNKTAFYDKVAIDEIPGCGSKEQVDELLSRPFRSALNVNWTDDTSSAPWSASRTAIVPKDYNGAFVGNTQNGCVKCHQDAATHVRFFDAGREWYGFVRGSKSEKILSFHPVAKSAISGNGSYTPVRWNQALIDAGIIEISTDAKK
jgi:hypothetical protein